MWSCKPLLKNSAHTKFHIQRISRWAEQDDDAMKKILFPYEITHFSFLFVFVWFWYHAQMDSSGVFLKWVLEQDLRKVLDKAETVGWPGRYWALSLVFQILFFKKAEDSRMLDFFSPASSFFSTLLCSTSKHVYSSTLLIVVIFPLRASLVCKASTKYCWNVFDGCFKPL